MLVFMKALIKAKKRVNIRFFQIRYLLLVIIFLLFIEKVNTDLLIS